MKEPPIYHLRFNKAIDRFTLIQAIKTLETTSKLNNYSYYGMGGPYLEDFRLIYESFPKLSMVSIESSFDTYKRQHRHLPCSLRKLDLRNEEIGSFITNYQANGRKSIFWLDYTKLKYNHFEDFMGLLPKVEANSIIKITLRAEFKDYFTFRAETDKQKEEIRKFKDEFGHVLPPEYPLPVLTLPNFAALLQEMIRISFQKILTAGADTTFQILSSFYYKDGDSPMFTLTGIVCQQSDLVQIKRNFKSLEHSNLNWAPPKQIDVPFLSTQERFFLQKYLPRKASRSGAFLQKKLGYKITPNTEASLCQYSEFHRYFPYYIKGIP